jgi:hypothetical protein
VIALAGAGQEPERLCPMPAPPRMSRIERYMEIRRGFGFRSDEPYVRRLIRRGVWEHDVGYIPVTPRENRYLRLRDRLQLGSAASRYLRRRADLSGGVSIEDGWPKGPYLLVRLTRDRVRHTRMLKRLARFPRNLRTTKVDLSERQLSRIQDRIDFDAHSADGFHVSSTGVDIDLGKVAIELITRRTDHLEYFRARHGPHVVTSVIATEPTSPDCRRIFRYRLAPDGLSLRIAYEAGGGATFDRVELVESDARVEIGVVVQQPNGAVRADSRIAEHTVTLSRPLGTRRVVDATTGRTVPEAER